MGKRAFIYARISQDRTGAGLGTARQIEDCRKLAEDKGLEVLQVFEDNDVSASRYSKKPRRGYLAMLERLAEVDAVLVWHADRLHRQPLELEEYVELVERHGVKTYASQGGEVDLVSPTGLLNAGIMGQLARYESAHRSARITRKHEQSAKLGTWRGGARPFGWDAVDGELLLNDYEAKLIRDASHAVLAGRSLGSIIREWEEAGVQTTGVGKGWNYATLKQVLMRPRNAGLSVYRGEVVGTLQAPAIISKDVWLAVCSVLSDPSRRRSQSNKAAHLLAGIAQCHCGEFVRSMTVRDRDGTKHRAYACRAKGKGHVGKRAAYVDAWVDKHMVFWIMYSASKSAGAPDVAEDVAAATAEVTAKRQMKIDSANLYADGSIDPQQLAVITQRLNGEIAVLEEKLAALQVAAARPVVPASMPDDLTGSDAEKEWFASSIDQRRDYVRAVCNVILFPHHKGSARVFDVDTVQIVMKSPEDGPGPMPVEAIDYQKREGAFKDLVRS